MYPLFVSSFNVELNTLYWWTHGAFPYDQLTPVRSVHLQPGSRLWHLSWGVPIHWLFFEWLGRGVSHLQEKNSVFKLRPPLVHLVSCHPHLFIIQSLTWHYHLTLIIRTASLYWRFHMIVIYFPSVCISRENRMTPFYVGRSQRKEGAMACSLFLC